MSTQTSTRNPLYTDQVHAQDLAYRQLLVQAREAGDSHNAQQIVAMLNLLPEQYVTSRRWGRR